MRTGRQSVYVVGRREDKSFAGDGSFIDETLFLYQAFGPDVHSQCTSDVHSQCTSDVHSQCTSFLIDKEIEKREIDSGGRKLTGHQKNIRRLSVVLVSYGREPPRPSVLGRWLKLCDGDVVLAEATLDRLGRQGHLADKPDEYLFAALTRAGRDAARETIPEPEDDDVCVVQTGQPTTSDRDDDENDDVCVVRTGDRPA